MKAIPDELWLAATIWQEARGEPYEGKLAVAYVIVNRTKFYKKSVGGVVLAPWQFSCWNTDSPTRGNLARLDAADPGWEECRRAAMNALTGGEPDPTQGASHYLNEATVKKVAGKLPSWFRPERVSARIGHHTFLKLEGDVE